MKLIFFLILLTTAFCFAQQTQAKQDLLYQKFTKAYYELSAEKVARNTLSLVFD